MREHGRQIARAGDGSGRHRLLDAGEIAGREFEIERAERFLELVAAARADQRHDVVAARLHPGEGELRGGRALLSRDLAERLDQRDVLGKILGGKARLAGADFARRVLGRLGAVADEAAGEHAIGDQRDAELAQGRQDVALDAAAEQRIFDLQRRDRMHRVRAPQRLGGRFRDADVAHVAGLHHVGDGADRVLDRHRRDRRARAGRDRRNRCRAGAANRRGNSWPPAAGRRRRGFSSPARASSRTSPR